MTFLLNIPSWVVLPFGDMLMIHLLKQNKTKHTNGEILKLEYKQINLTVSNE